jgi:hypothetical protein
MKKKRRRGATGGDPIIEVESIEACKANRADDVGATMETPASPPKESCLVAWQDNYGLQFGIYAEVMKLGEQPARLFEQ